MNRKEYFTIAEAANLLGMKTETLLWHARVGHFSVNRKLRPMVVTRLELARFALQTPTATVFVDDILKTFEGADRTDRLLELQAFEQPPEPEA